jgi:hypothetical protein
MLTADAMNDHWQWRPRSAERKLDSHLSNLHGSSALPVHVTV